jgi:3'-phosphoadenosine 5'-phosphosulfate sulfotransferase (PAPS reductase)/FAD synthetase
MTAHETVNVINISGGKDSTATLLKAIEDGAENLTAVFADTGNEHPDTYEYVGSLRNSLSVEIKTVRADLSEWFARRIEYLQSERAIREWPEDARVRAIKLMQPTGNPFLDLCMLKGRFPSRKAQFCTQFLKRGPIYTQVFEPALFAGKRVISWQGVRRDESEARKHLAEFEADFAADPDGPGLFIYRPILDWSVEDVFAMHRRHQIDPNPLYMQGMSRVGCMPCINASKSEIREIADRFPEHIERIAEWERIVSRVAKREMATFFAVRDVASEDVSLRRHGIHSRVEWSRTSRGGRQMQMFQETPMCSSAYGLCE